MFESIRKFENKVDKISEDNGTLIKMVGELKDSKLKLAKIERNMNFVMWLISYLVLNNSTNNHNLLFT